MTIATRPDRWALPFPRTGGVLQTPRGREKAVALRLPLRTIAPSPRRTAIARYDRYLCSRKIHQTFTAALDALVEEIKKDRAILAVVLCGSLSHDTVWAQSDIDLVLVTIDDRKVENAGISLNADGVDVHAC